MRSSLNFKKGSADQGELRPLVCQAEQPASNSQTTVSSTSTCRVLRGPNLMIDKLSRFVSGRNSVIREAKLLETSRSRLQEPLLNAFRQDLRSQDHQTSASASTSSSRLGSSSHVEMGAPEVKVFCTQSGDPTREMLRELSSGPQSAKLWPFTSRGLNNSNHQDHPSVAKGLLALLWTKRNPKRRPRPGELVARLLRPPVLAAASFSLALVVTLMTLLSLSLIHIHNHTSKQGVYHSSANGKQLDYVISGELSNYSQASNNNNNENNPFDAPLTVQTECATFVGIPSGRGIEFRAIPYAVAPVGSLRWTKPRPVWLDGGACRPGERRLAHEFASHCAQVSLVTQRFSGHEDCLYLDVFAPRVSQSGSQDQKLPVMVYIHGGFLAFGSSGQGQVNWMRAQPSARLASELNVIFVGLNFRLQALGFLALEQLARDKGPDGVEGNYGLWDQLVALEWIQRNIAAFGGDPSNVVLFGPDSASALVWALLDPNHSRGLTGSASGSRGQELFRSAWLSDPTLFYDVEPEVANKHYERLFVRQLECLESKTNESRSESDKSGANSTTNTNSTQEVNTNNSYVAQLLECLMSLSAEEVLRHYLGADNPSYRLDDQNSMPIHGVRADQFVTVDGELVARPAYPPLPKMKLLHDLDDERVPAQTKDPQATGSRPIQLLLGSSAQAVEYWPCPRELHRWTWQDLDRYVATSLNSFVNPDNTYSKAMHLYNQSHVSAGVQVEPQEVYLNMVSDIRQVCPIGDMSRALTSSKVAAQITRYVVQTRPSRGYPIRRQPSNDATQTGTNATSNEPKSPTINQDVDGATETDTLSFAFHSWDLIAFFGFEFEPRFEPSKRDYDFQRSIRSLVMQLVHHQHHNETLELASGSSASSEQQHPRIYANLSLKLKPNSEAYDSTNINLLVNKSGLIDILKPNSRYKQAECDFWRQHLGSTYAWIS